MFKIYKNNNLLDKTLNRKFIIYLAKNINTNKKTMTHFDFFSFVNCFLLFNFSAHTKILRLLKF